MLDDQQEGPAERYVRRDQTMSKRVYRSQLVREVFGAAVARFFMRFMKVRPTVAQRVLQSARDKLRR